MKRNITDELLFALPRYTTNAEMILDNDEDLNWDMVYECHIMNCNYSNIYERKATYESITPARLMKVAQEIFIPDNTTLTLKTDKKSFDTESAHNILMNLR